MNTYQLMICPDDPGTVGRVTPQKSITITENGEYSVRPDDGYQGIAGVDVDVKVKWVVPDGFSCQGSTLMVNFDGTTWDTSALTSLGQMFYNCGFMKTCDVTGWDTSKVTSLIALFWNDFNLKEIRGLNTWDVSKVSGVQNKLFYDCEKLETLDISGWDFSKVTSISDSFYKCNSLTEVKVIGCNEYTQNLFYQSLKNNLIGGEQYTWTLGTDGIIRRS